LERDLGCPQDIEWAVMRNKLYLLQSRPITTFVEYDPLTGEWNSTFSGDYLWTNFISAEVFPIAASPSTWSLWQLFFERMFSLGDLVALGNIAYRPYLNYSLMYSFLMKILRKHERVVGVVGDSIGTPPENIEIPTMPIPLKTLLFKLIPREIKNNFAKKKLKNLIPDFFTDIFDQCQDLKKQINQIKEKNDLISIWREKIKPIYFDIQLLQDALNEDLNGFNRTLKKNLGKFLGEEDINTFFTSLSSQSEQLASIGQLVGLAKIKNGNLSREDYMSLYGHRGPYENYLLIPRPYEDPSWLEKQLEEFNRSPVDVENLLMKRASEFDAIWHKLKQKVKPKHAQTFKQLIDKIQNTFLEREQIRSELTRLVGIIREWFLRAGDLTELGEDIFYLTIDEVIETLLGDHSSTSYIPARRETYAKYRSLTSLPIWIRGRFDPIQWDNNPDRRFDYFDPYTSVSSILDTGDIIKGNPGSAGRVEGVVRRIDSLEEGHLLQSGEILVTNSTNIGWTPIFPRLTAVITDVGAALSHAAIVARELGIPAVVGCRNATTRLKTGDRVLVDGAQGVIKILEVVEKS
ncbi:MAG: PEP-utilizing enzyme, partial [Promethearchaeota archaeon]